MEICAKNVLVWILYIRGLFKSVQSNSHRCYIKPAEQIAALESAARPPQWLFAISRKLVFVFIDREEAV